MRFKSHYVGKRVEQRKLDNVLNLSIESSNHPFKILGAFPYINQRGDRGTRLRTKPVLNTRSDTKPVLNTRSDVSIY